MATFDEILDTISYNEEKLSKLKVTVTNLNWDIENIDTISIPSNDLKVKNIETYNIPINNN